MGELRLFETVVGTLPTTVAEAKGVGVAEDDDDPEPEEEPPGVGGELTAGRGLVLLLPADSCAPRLPVTTTPRE